MLNMVSQIHKLYPNLPMQTKQPTIPKDTTSLLKYRFICQRQLSFGQALYLLGNVQQLGQWKPQNAIRLICYQGRFWISDIQIPTETSLQYKFFIAADTEQTKQPISPSFWIGDQMDNNLQLFISRHQEKLLDQERKSKELRVMSFNIRCQCEKDKNEFSWENRKMNCLRLIKQQLPSILGIQEATMSQVSYLKQQLSAFYDFLPAESSADLDQFVGMFYDRQRFIVVEQGTRWISESKQPGSTGFGAHIPRMFTFAVLEDTFTSRRFMHAFRTPSSKDITQFPRELFFVQNIYLDYHATQSQKAGLTMLADEIKAKKEQYKEEIKDVFVLGDFNLPEVSNLIHNFEKSDCKVESIRKNFLRRKMKDNCDLGFTFHAFEHEQHDIENPQKAIDHIFISTTDYEPTKFQVIRSLQQKPKHSKTSIISDHFPIMGVFRHKHATYEYGSSKHKEEVSEGSMLKHKGQGVKESKQREEGMLRQKEQGVLREMKLPQDTAHKEEGMLKEKKLTQSTGLWKEKPQQQEAQQTQKPKRKSQYTSKAL